jgi:hypothetical protein
MSIVQYLRSVLEDGVQANSYEVRETCVHQASKSVVDETRRLRSEPLNERYRGVATTITQFRASRPLVSYYAIH